jgi:type VI secretion system protein ImpI/type VI secretion system protein
MTLTLSVLRCPDAVPPETKRLQGGEFRIGRGPDNDWVLSDPDRVLSKRHCVIAFRAGGWQIADTSTNGTYLNRDSEPLGSAGPKNLNDGDRIRLGSYEIEARIAEVGGFASATLTAKPSPFDDPFGDDPFAAPKSGFRPDPLFGASEGGFGGQNPALPAHFDPLAPSDDEQPFGAPTQADHTPSYSDAFRPPPVAPRLIPDDWDLDLSPQAAPARPQPPRPAAPTPHPFAEPGDFGGLSEPAPAALPAGAPVAPPAQPAPPAMAAQAETPAAMQPAASGDLLAAFLEGAGMAGQNPADPEAMMRALGAGFRALVSGIRQALIARAAIKGEFRIEQTMIRARGNNPLKFSADDDDALAALLGTGRRSDISAEAAIADALRDMRLHELASMAAMQVAVRALLARLDPAALRAGAEQGGMSVLPAQKKARAFDAFEALHGSITRALADDFDSVFGKAFARAYEQALREAQAREG